MAFLASVALAWPSPGCWQAFWEVEMGDISFTVSAFQIKKYQFYLQKKKKRDYFPKAVQQITTHGIPSNKSFIIS